MHAWATEIQSSKCLLTQTTFTLKQIMPDPSKQCIVAGILQLDHQYPVQATRPSEVPTTVIGPLLQAKLCK
jgi:hypothetical protein